MKELWKHPLGKMMMIITFLFAAAALAEILTRGRIAGADPEIGIIRYTIHEITTKIKDFTDHIHLLERQWK